MFSVIQKKMIIGLSIFLCMLLSLGGLCVIVNQRENAMILQFGEAVRTILTPGLHFKVPFIQSVEFFDKRLLSVDVDAKELTAADGKRIIIDAFVRFKIIDPVLFYRTMRNEHGLKIRVNRLCESSMRKVIGTANLSALLTDQRSDIMHRIKVSIEGELVSFGVQVVDVRILRADLPKENSAAIYSRMQTDREKEAKQIRAEGYEEAAKIQSRADKESKIISSQALLEAQNLKAQADKEAAQIYNVAYGSDPEFYQFYQSLLVYEALSHNTFFVLQPGSEFLKHLKLYDSRKM
ncbi:Modulator of FtsH protease HflC [Rickettsiales endosymbiont of Paramecium tredecaurelia]|uniref:protease modulator HflC n=1 Tax=Candidatus Sarmatiella mevalonica TaxID=2770581 RepID=UPI001FC86D63|nr:protease modulator HflC [Candidatus Sarmatiella mevalonica]MBL3284968.1 Modulator of FtsH protease HflC [Candidatus Sarmatiella mevalonica]